MNVGTDRHWRTDGVCRQVDPELFFPVAERGPSLADQEARAKAVCQHCPVLETCREWALESQPFGVAGGMGEGERRRVRLGLRPNAGVAELRRAALRLAGEGVPLVEVAEQVGRSLATVSVWCKQERMEIARAETSAESETGERRSRGLVLLSGGHSTAEVAERVGVSARTVERWAADGPAAEPAGRAS